MYKINPLFIFTILTNIISLIYYYSSEMLQLQIKIVR